MAVAEFCVEFLIVKTYGRIYARKVVSKFVSII